MQDDRHMILLNKTGDVCISWNKESETEMLTYIQKKIDAGYVFFIMDSSFFRMKKRKKYISSVNDIGTNRKVYLDDADAEKLYEEKKISLVKLNGGDLTYDTVAKATTAQEVLNHNTVATRPLRGG